MRWVALAPTSPLQRTATPTARGFLTFRSLLLQGGLLQMEYERKQVANRRNADVTAILTAVADSLQTKRRWWGGCAEG